VNCYKGVCKSLVCFVYNFAAGDILGISVPIFKGCSLLFVTVLDFFLLVLRTV
jgi:hypothetical protein